MHHQYEIENEFEKVHIKNHMYYYFDDIIKLEDFDIGNILIDEKSHKTVLIYDISCKTLIRVKLLRIRFDKIDGFIRMYDGTRCLTLFGSEKYNAIYNKIRDLVSLIYVFPLYYAKIKVNFYDSLPIKKH